LVRVENDKNVVMTDEKDKASELELKRKEVKRFKESIAAGFYVFSALKMNGTVMSDGAFLNPFKW